MPANNRMQVNVNGYAYDASGDLVDTGSPEYGGRRANSERKDTWRPRRGGLTAAIPRPHNPNPLEVHMLIKNGAITGAVVGAGTAAAMILFDQWMPFSIPINSFIDRVIFNVCPFYILGFSSYVTNEPMWFLVTILGNAVLYGIVFALIAAGVVLFRKATTYRQRKICGIRK